MKSIHYYIKIVSLGLMFGNFCVLAQQNDTVDHRFSLGLQFIPRAEFKDGALRPLGSSEKPAGLVSQRTRLVFDYTFKDLLTVRVSPQSVSVWGQAKMVQGVENSGNQFSLFETWAQLKLSPSWFMRAGRQVISLDDERFFGELDWAQGARSHDALSFQFSKNKFEIKSYFAFNQNYRVLNSNDVSLASGNLYYTKDAFPYKWMQTVWASLPIKDKSKITVLITNLGFQNAAVSKAEYFGQTVGANYYYIGEKSQVQLTGYFQGGTNENGMRTEGYMASASYGYNFTKQWKMNVGSDLVTGKNVGSTSRFNTAFNPYFTTGHKFYGFMDYYYAGNAHKNAGISDSYLKFAYKGKKGFGASLDLHQFFAPVTITGPTQTYDSNLGQEFDLTLSYVINKFTTLKGGYSCYLTTPSINYLKTPNVGPGYQQWAWLGLTVNPTLFKTK